jgi:DNA-binding response OmpR family regulator
MSANILLVEDDRDLAEAIRLVLEDEDWRVEHVDDGTEGLRRAQSGAHDLLILDIRLPGKSGLDICREVRRTSNVPILFLTARDTETDKVIGLELGADDYIAKPFGMRELRARIGALLRRASVRPEEEKRIRIHDLVLFPERQAVYRGEERIHLTLTEFNLLLAMAKKPGKVLTRTALADLLWQTERNTGSAPTVNVHIRNLRLKLGDDPEQARYIASVRGVGYMLVAEST